MPRLQSDRPYETSRPDPRVSRLLGQWLLLGVLIAALFPAARGYSDVIGWLPLWLLGAPLVSLLVLHRDRLRVHNPMAPRLPVAPGSPRGGRGVGQARRVGTRRRVAAPARIHYADRSMGASATAIGAHARA